MSINDRPYNYNDPYKYWDLPHPRRDEPRRREDNCLSDCLRDSIQIPIFASIIAAAPAAVIGVASTIFSLGLKYFGHNSSESALTAMFTITAVCGLGIALVGAVSYAIFGQNHRPEDFD